MNYTIWVNNTAVPVSEEVYKTYWKGERKERYFVEGDIHNHTFSYDALDTDEMNGCEMFSDLQSASPEEHVIHNMEKRHLLLAVRQLSPEERHIINRIYYHRDSFRKLSADSGIALSTLHYRHQRIIDKLRGYMEADTY